MGTGTHWADTPILVANGLTVVKNPEYELLYNMLAVGRFPCFPRGINQLEGNLNAFGPEGKGLAIEIEKRLLFSYPFFSILFVSKKNPQLKARLLEGYAKVSADGAWKAKFQSSWKSQKTRYKKLNLKNRIHIPLKNPFMTPAAAQIDITQYELNPME